MHSLPLICWRNPGISTTLAFLSKPQLKLPVAVLIDAKPWGTEFKLKSYPMDARDKFVYKTDLIRRTKQTCDRLQISYPDIKIPLATD